MSFNILTIHSNDCMRRLNVSMFEDVGQPSCVAILSSYWSSGSCVPGLASHWSTHQYFAVIGQMWRNSACTATGGILEPVPGASRAQSTHKISRLGVNEPQASADTIGPHRHTHPWQQRVVCNYYGHHNLT